MVTASSVAQLLNAKEEEEEEEEEGETKGVDEVLPSLQQSLSVGEDKPIKKYDDSPLPTFFPEGDDGRKEAEEDDVERAPPVLDFPFFALAVDDAVVDYRWNKEPEHCDRNLQVRIMDPECIRH